MRYTLLLSLSLSLAACGGGDGNGDDLMGIPDALPIADGPPVQTDAPPSTQMGLGQACTPVAGSPQADCPAGFECLALNGGSGAWCSKTCTQGAGDTCAQGYTGPGLASCIWQITADSQTRMFCGIVCEATNPAQCSATQCDGTCPTPLACTAELMNNDMMVVAKACF